MVMRLLWKAVEGPPRNWRSIAKALILVDHILKHGAEKVVADVQQHKHDIAALTDFSYIEGNLDRGSGGTRVIATECSQMPLVLLFLSGKCGHDCFGILLHKCVSCL